MRWRRAPEPDRPDHRLPSWTADVPRRDLDPDEHPAALPSASIPEPDEEDVETLVARVLGEVDQAPAATDHGTVLASTRGSGPDDPIPVDVVDRTDSADHGDDAFHVERLLEAFEDEISHDPGVVTEANDAAPRPVASDDEELAGLTSQLAERQESPFHVERARAAVAEALLALEHDDRPVPPEPVDVRQAASTPTEADEAVTEPRAPAPDGVEGSEGDVGVGWWGRLRARLGRPEGQERDAPDPPPVRQAVTVRRVEQRPAPGPALATRDAAPGTDEPRTGAQEASGSHVPAEAVDASDPRPAPARRRRGPPGGVRVESAPREDLERARQHATGAWQRPPEDGGAWGRVADRLDRR